MIKLRNITKFFEDKSGINHVLRGIDMDVAEGEFVSIMGPSGAGKSLLLNILGMYDGAWKGEYLFLDQSVHRLNPKQRAELNKKHVGFVFQQFHLLDDLTVAENLDIPLSYRSIKKSERERRGCRSSGQVWLWSVESIFIQVSSPAACNNWWPWRARWLGPQGCFWLMSRRATCIPNRASRSWSSSRS